MGTNMVLCSILFWPGCLACSPSHSNTVAAESTGLPICFTVDSEPIVASTPCPSTRSTMKGGGANWDTWNNPGIYSCHMQLYCFWYIVVCYHNNLQCFWWIGKLKKAECHRLNILFECPFWSFLFVDKSNQEGHIVAECLASSPFCLSHWQNSPHKQQILVTMCWKCPWQALIVAKCLSVGSQRKWQPDMVERET